MTGARPGLAGPTPSPWALCGALALAACTNIPGRTDHAQLDWGRREFTTDVQGPVSHRGLDQDVLEARYLNTPDAGGLGWELSLGRGWGESSDALGTTKLETWELTGGGIWAARAGTALRPYVGAGWWMTHGSLDDTVGPNAFKFQDVGLGLYARTGLWFGGGSSGLGGGLDLKFSGGPPWFAGGPRIDDESGGAYADVQLDNVQLSLVVSWSF